MERPFAVDGPEAFNALALDLFRLHAAHNPVYRAFLEGLRITPDRVGSIEAIPFLPIQAFRDHRVLLEGLTPALTFTSSGTTAAITARHHVPWPELYARSFMTGFRNALGEPATWRIIALLPAYLERPDSSLVLMAQRLVEASGDPLGGLYLNQYAQVADLLRRSEEEGRRTLLLGVPFALLDLAERHPMTLRHVHIVETGGMKGRRPELVREDLHTQLRQAFGVDQVGGEYGMTELLSQAWSPGAGRYHCPPWMAVRIREVNDPFAPQQMGRTGGIDVIDLCNIASCPFISTQDLGRLHPDGSFEVLGRFDHSDVRGCNLLAEA
ncbi:MAG TPA: acyl transferase [Flavobacteriales bacterium]|nr:acyl transferase [Flavobacteriales bacterium]HQW85681.1 acyl transferase [Flavobacteriales bacterium]